MKMYEKLGIDLTTKEGLARVISIRCEEIPNEPSVCNSTCLSCKAERLFAEVPTKKVKRWETYNGDFIKAKNDFRQTYIRGILPSTADALYDYAEWLMTEVEVEDGEL